MADLIETGEWVAGIYQIETTDPVLGGPPNLAIKAGVANIAAQQLADRTTWLKAQVDGLGAGFDASNLETGIVPDARFPHFAVTAVASDSALRALDVTCHVVGAPGVLSPPLAIGGLIRHSEFSDGIAVQVADRYSAAGIFLSRYMRRRSGGTWGGFAPVGPRVGSTISLSRGTVPTSLLKLNGALLNRVSYADLFAEIGTTWGAGDGYSSFALPDLRGEFLRGWDEGRGADPRRVFGGWQQQDIQPHAHSYLRGANSFGHTGEGSGSFNHTGGTYMTGVQGGTETRPRNITQLFCIQY